jgi:hypothetical protein
MLEIVTSSRKGNSGAILEGHMQARAPGLVGLTRRPRMVKNSNALKRCDVLLSQSPVPVSLSQVSPG